MFFLKETTEKAENILIKRNLKTLFFEVLLLLCSAVLLSLSFPSSISLGGFGFLSVIALIPLFAVIDNTTFPLAPVYGFIYGFVFYQIFNSWLSAFHPYANLIVQIIKGTEMALLFLALKTAYHSFSKRVSFIIQSFLWVAYAYLSQSWFAGYPYGTIAYSFYNYRLFIQIADFSGIWLLTFMIVFPQAFFGCFFRNLINRILLGKNYPDKETISLRSAVRSNRTVLLIYVCLFVFQVIYGIVSLSYWGKKTPERTFKVAAVQHNSDSWKGGFETYKRNFLNLKMSTLEAIRYNPDVDMVVWSETAFVPSVSWYTEYPYTGSEKGFNFDYLRNTQKLVSDFVEFGNGLGVPLLTGNPTSKLAEGTTEPYTDDGDWNNKIDYNSVILFDEGKIKQTYIKQHLVPFTEHFPYKDTLPHFYAFLEKNDYHWWEKGTESVVFETSNGIKFSTPICFEDVFGYLCADFVKNGANLLVNMTNDNWSKSVVAEFQHACMAVFRSVEVRKSMLRGTNSGITCLITPSGEIKDSMEPFKEGYHVYDVPVYESDSDTVYVRTLDAPVLIISIVVNVVLISGFVLNLVRNKILRKKRKD